MVRTYNRGLLASRCTVKYHKIYKKQREYYPEDYFPRPISVDEMYKQIRITFSQ